jgi:hypothetical protein
MRPEPQLGGTEIGEIDPVGRTEPGDLGKTDEGLVRMIHRQVDHAERLERPGIVGIVPQQPFAESLRTA